eukprot:13300384-Alexandrium_andersonii.AAC.1
MVELPAERHCGHRRGAKVKQAGGSLWRRRDCSTGVEILACSTMEARWTLSMHRLRVPFVHMRIL